MSLQIYTDPDFEQLPPTSIFVAKPVGRAPKCKPTAPNPKLSTSPQPSSLPASTSSLPPLIFFIPGNPGLPDYYTSYLTDLSKHLPRYEIVCASHLGQDPLVPAAEAKSYLDPEQDYFTLDQQVDHKVNLINSMCKNAKNRAIYVFGHSVGAWIAQRVAVRLSQERLPLTVKSKSKSKSKPKPKPNIDLKFVGLITPTLIDIAKSEKGEKLCWWSSKIEKSVPGLSMANIAFTTSKFVSSCVPLSWQKRLITWVMGRDIKNHVVQATIKLLNRPDICHQCLRMAKEEMIRINSEFEPKDIEGFWPSKSGPQTDSETELDSSPASTTGSMNGVKIWIWFASNDHWVSPASRANLIERYTFMDNMLMEVGKGAMNMESLADVEHSFCVRKSEEFADITSKRILFFDQI